MKVSVADGAGGGDRAAEAGEAVAAAADEPAEAAPATDAPAVAEVKAE